MPRLQFVQTEAANFRRHVMAHRQSIVPNAGGANIRAFIPRDPGGIVLVQRRCIDFARLESRRAELARAPVLGEPEEVALWPERPRLDLGGDASAIRCSLSRLALVFGRPVPSQVSRPRHQSRRYR